MLEQPLPPCLKAILYSCGYDNISNIGLLDENKVIEIEEYISEFGRSTINDLNCCYSQQYQNQSNFKFLPGHRAAILSLPHHTKNAWQMRIKNESESNGPFSTVLTELIKTAEKNSGKDKNHAHYNEVVRHFSTYYFCYLEDAAMRR